MKEAEIRALIQPMQDQITQLNTELLAANTGTAAASMNKLLAYDSASG